MPTTLPPGTRELTLTQGAIQLLKSLMGTTEWYKDKPKHYIAAAKLLATPTLKAKPPLFEKTQEEAGSVAAYNRLAREFMDSIQEPWLDATVSLVVEDDQYEMLQAMLIHYLKAGALQVTKYGFDAIVQLAIEKKL